MMATAASDYFYGHATHATSGPWDEPHEAESDTGRSETPASSSAAKYSKGKSWKRRPSKEKSSHGKSSKGKHSFGKHPLESAPSAETPADHFYSSYVGASYPSAEDGQGPHDHDSEQLGELYSAGGSSMAETDDLGVFDYPASYYSPIPYYEPVAPSHYRSIGHAPTSDNSRPPVDHTAGKSSTEATEAYDPYSSGLFSAQVADNFQPESTGQSSTKATTLADSDPYFAYGSTLQSYFGKEPSMAATVDNSSYSGSGVGSGRETSRPSATERGYGTLRPSEAPQRPLGALDHDGK